MTSMFARLPARGRRWLLGVAKLAVAGGILTYLFNLVPLAEIGAAMGSAAPAPLVLAFAVAFGAQVMLALRLSRLIRRGLKLEVSELPAWRLRWSWLGWWPPPPCGSSGFCRLGDRMAAPA